MFYLPPEDRLRLWREFRHSLNLLSLEKALTQIAEFWAKAPFTPYYLDMDSIENWPDPWELINENTYCDIAKCLGIVYTTLLTTHRSNLPAEIRIYADLEKNYEYNLAWLAQGKYILNMIDGEVVNIEQFDKTLKLKKIITAVDLKLDNY
jgi:hypothetical protein